MRAKPLLKKWVYVIVAASLLSLLVLASCATPTPEVVEVIVTQIVKETVKETVIVEGTPQIVEKEVEKVVEKTVEVMVTPTPDTSEIGVMKSVPRNRTWVIGGWEFTANLNGSDNFNPIMNVASLRTNYAKFVYEALFYNNLNTGEEYPWLAESYDVDDDYMGMDIYLRKGVEWADGQPFTCTDVKYTIETQRDIDTAQGQHGYFLKWVESVDCVDDFKVRINYTGANPRFYQHIMVGHENQFVIVPKHIFEGKDVTTFTNLDLGKGLPLGSGPYKVVLVTSQQVVYDRRDDWWGAKIGFMDLPEPERIVATTGSSDQVYAEMYMANKIDYGGFALQVGSFEAAKEKNPAMRSWYSEGPVYGAPDGCVYQLALNNAKYSDVNVRLAMNYAIDRQEVANLAYQGATHPSVAPFSSYIAGAWGSVIDPLIEKYDRDAPSQDKVDEYMVLAGYEKNVDGIWEKDGVVADMTIVVPQSWAPLGPVLAEQLSRAGFQAEEQLDTANQWAALHQTGEADAVAFVHCGSLYDPYDTLSQFHSKHTVSLGETDNNGGGIFAYHRYAGDPELDTVLDEMEKTPPFLTNPEYVKWAETAIDIYLRDMPTIVLAEELHVVTMNETYWTGYPTSEDPYVAPYPCWNDFTMTVFHVKPTQ
ncbi:MAG: ABC transporter substrate-binding protein [Anaerolineae bacterium]|nr:ABC transporter substrate-binding protein [Anaerolineae bacterium]